MCNMIDDIDTDIDVIVMTSHSIDKEVSKFDEVIGEAQKIIDLDNDAKAKEYIEKELSGYKNLILKNYNEKSKNQG